MSPLFASEYCAALAPGRIELTRRRGGLRRRTQAFHCANLETARDEGGSWSFALTALESLLKDDRPMRGRLRVVLSSHWVRYQLIPWNDALLTPDEFAMYARACFERVHGELVAGWDISVDPGAAGQPRLACAVDKPLLESLDTLCGWAGWKLAGVQPYLSHAFNPLRASLARKSFLFALAEPGRLSLLAAQDGVWRAVRNTAIGGETLQAMVERELSLLDLGPEAEILVHAPGLRAPALPDCAASGWRLIPAGGSADYAMAWGTVAA